MPIYNTNYLGAPGIRYAVEERPFYCFGSFRDGMVTDAAPLNIIGVETAEVGPTTATASLQCAIAHHNSGFHTNDKTIAVILRYPVAPAAISIALQISDRDIDADYQTVGGMVSTNVLGDYMTMVSVQANFARIKVLSATGTYSIVAVLVVK